MAKTPVKSVTEYIAAQPEPGRLALERVRRALRTALAGADEVIAYNIPAYRIDGRVVLYFAGWKRHWSLYPATAPLVDTFKKELGPYEVNQKGTIRFPVSEAVPVSLIKRLARFRRDEVAANRTRAARTRATAHR